MFPCTYIVRPLIPRLDFVRTEIEQHVPDLKTPGFEPGTLWSEVECSTARPNTSRSTYNDANCILYFMCNYSNYKYVIQNGQNGVPAKVIHINMVRRRVLGELKAHYDTADYIYLRHGPPIFFWLRFTENQPGWALPAARAIFPRSCLMRCSTDIYRRMKNSIEEGKVV